LTTRTNSPSIEVASTLPLTPCSTPPPHLPPLPSLQSQPASATSYTKNKQANSLKKKSKSLAENKSINTSTVEAQVDGHIKQETDRSNSSADEREQTVARHNEMEKSVDDSIKEHHINYINNNNNQHSSLQQQKQNSDDSIEPKLSTIELLSPTKVCISDEQFDPARSTRSVGVHTDTQDLCRLETGTNILLEGVVWNETSKGILIVNVTWKGKSYVGSLIDANRADWAPPRFKEFPKFKPSLNSSANSYSSLSSSSALFQRDPYSYYGNYGPASSLYNNDPNQLSTDPTVRTLRNGKRRYITQAFESEQTSDAESNTASTPTTSNCTNINSSNGTDNPPCNTQGQAILQVSSASTQQFNTNDKTNTNKTKTNGPEFSVSSSASSVNEEELDSLTQSSTTSSSSTGNKSSKANKKSSNKMNKNSNNLKIEEKDTIDVARPAKSAKSNSKSKKTSDDSLCEHKNANTNSVDRSKTPVNNSIDEDYSSSSTVTAEKPSKSKKKANEQRGQIAITQLNNSSSNDNSIESS
jgi:hypothetical protein